MQAALPDDHDIQEIHDLRAEVVEFASQFPQVGV